MMSNFADSESFIDGLETFNNLLHKSKSVLETLEPNVFDSLLCAVCGEVIITIRLYFHE